MKMIKCIMDEIKENRTLFGIIFVGWVFVGIGIAIENKDWGDLFFVPLFGMATIGGCILILCVFLGIRNWLRLRAFLRLSPENQAIILKDIVRQKEFEKYTRSSSQYD